ncbi:MAG: hypothetical protein HQL50_01335 [Magnetococcales bacterium]|nr:hypothetical protein [Magnetococcales bacterium]
MATAPLTVIPEKQTPHEQGEVIFRERPFAPILFALLFGGSALALLLIPIVHQLHPDLKPLQTVWPYGLGAGFAFMLFLLFRGTVTALFRDSNWLLRASEKGLAVKFRSYRNHRLPEEDDCVILIPREAVLGLTIQQEKREVIDNFADNADRKFNTATRTDTHISLLVTLSALEIPALERHLNAERKRRITTRTGSFIVKHYPVTMEGSDRLKITWSSPESRIHPKITEAAEILNRLFPGRLRYSEQERPMVRQPGKEADAQIVQLAREGGMIAAMEMARAVYGCDLTQAKQKVDDLLAQEERSADSDRNR